MTAPRRRMYGPGVALRPTTSGDERFTGPTFSDDEIDAMYGLTGPAPAVCVCYDAASMEFDPAGPCGLPGCRAKDSNEEEDVA